MGHFDPERSDPTGRREIASHYYPLIGPYDSADPDVLEYHTLLMKVAGIDGVVADWYGSEDFNDYALDPPPHRPCCSTALKRRGLKFAVCYEDRVLKAMAERQKLDARPGHRTRPDPPAVLRGELVQGPRLRDAGRASRS